MLLASVLEPLNARGRVFEVGGACGCVEACYEERYVEGGCCGVYIHVKVTFSCL